MKLNYGDTVIAPGIGEGKITYISTDNIADVEFNTVNGGCTLQYHLSELQYVPKRTARLWAHKSVHGTVNVIIQNCSSEVTTLLWRFDIWKSNGNFKFDETKPNERAKIWFECPIEFLDFIESSMGRACFERMGVEEFNIEH
jgi:hypothetical protein